MSSSYKGQRRDEFVVKFVNWILRNLTSKEYQMMLAAAVQKGLEVFAAEAREEQEMDGDEKETPPRLRSWGSSN